jgi:hypothetical protein
MQGHFIMVHSENGGEEVMSVQNIFSLNTEEDGDYCFLSGFALTRDKSKEELGVMCYLLQPAPFVIVPLLAGTRLEGVSVMPYYFVQGAGKDKEAVVLSTHMLVAPRETVSAFPDNLFQQLLTQRQGLWERADAKVLEEAAKAAKRAAEGQPDRIKTKVRKLSHAELQTELKKHGVDHTYSLDHEVKRKRGKPFVADACRKLLLAKLSKAAALAAGASAQSAIESVQAEAAGAGAGGGPVRGAAVPGAAVPGAAVPGAAVCGAAVGAAVPGAAAGAAAGSPA